MVGNEEGNGHICHFVQGLHCPPRCRGFGAPRISVSECSHPALARQSLAADGLTEDKIAAETTASSGFHDEGRSREVSMDGKTYPSLSALLSDRLVHGEPEKRYYWPKMVNDRHRVRRDEEEGT